MRKKIMVLFILGCGLVLFFPPLPEKIPLTSVFRITENPVVITRGTYSSALTVNISFGDDDVEKWIQTLEKPYPLLLVDPDWAGRFPETVRLINEKSIPTGLLGHEGATYEKNGQLLNEQIKQFESFFDVKPLWFRTIDEVFPSSLHALLWKAEINALGSTVTWEGEDVPPTVEGEIISIPHHQKNRIDLSKLKKLTESRDFQTIDEVLFGPIGKTKKIPK